MDKFQICDGVHHESVCPKARFAHGACGKYHHPSTECPEPGYEMSAAEAAVTPPDRDLQSSVTNGGRVKLPPADSWDTQTGHGQHVKLNVRAYYTPFNDEWFTLHLHLDFDGKDRPLTESALLVSRNPTHDPPSAALLKAIALTKDVFRESRAVVRSLEVRNPALMDPESNTIIHLEAWVAGRLGVALAINDGVVSVTSVN